MTAVTAQKEFSIPAAQVAPVPGACTLSTKTNASLTIATAISALNNNTIISHDILFGTATIICIFGANTLNKKKQAALTSAYAYLNTSFNEYKDKVKAIYGEDGEKRVREEIAKDKYIQQSMPESNEDMLFFDEYSGRYFELTLFDLQNAVYRLNRTFALEGYTNLNEFYRYVDLPETDYGEVLGWSGLKCWEVFNKAWIDIKWDDMELPDGLVAQAIHFPIPPEEGYEEW